MRKDLRLLIHGGDLWYSSEEPPISINFVCRNIALPMADPVSVIASIASIATTGACLARSLFEIVEAIRGAPREISDVASELSVLLNIMYHLHEVLHAGKEMYKPCLTADIKQVLSKIRELQIETRAMIEGSTTMWYLRWYWTGRKVRGMMLKIEGYENSANLILNVMLVAIS